MTVSSLARQLIVIVSPQLAALSVGGAVSFPSVLIQQLNANDSSIHLEMDTTSWVGSIHGLAGIPSIVMPALMQWKGRKFAFIIACLISITGWTLALTATSSVAILISESFHGLGNNSILAVSLLSMSEMVTPQYRNMAMVSYTVMQTFGMVLLSIIGRYLHWKTVALIMGSPILLALLMGLFWPESPSWLAYKGHFDKCEQVFVLLRGTGEMAKQELKELITAEKENRRVNIKKTNKQSFNLRIFMQRDFYLPTLHICVLIYVLYWSGGLVILIYSNDIIQIATNNENVSFFGNIIMCGIHFICVGMNVILVRRFQIKSILLLGIICTVFILICTSTVNFMQTVGIIPEDSLICLYLLAMYTAALSLAVIPIVLTVAAELMPVKHRGVGGALFVVFCCIFHASSLKAAPYLLLYIKLWGTLIIYATNAALCGIYVWKFVPETKGRTLLELEDFYNNGNFKTRHSMHYLSLERIHS